MRVPTDKADARSDAASAPQRPTVRLSAQRSRGLDFRRHRRSIADRIGSLLAAARDLGALVARPAV